MFVILKHLPNSTKYRSKKKNTSQVIDCFLGKLVHGVQPQGSFSGTGSCFGRLTASFKHSKDTDVCFLSYART